MIFSSHKRFNRLLIIVICAFLILIGYFVTFSYYQSLREAENTSLMRLQGIANSLAIQIDGDAHAALMETYVHRDAILSADEDSTYKKIHQLLAQNYVANMLKTPIYTLVIDSIAQECVFGVTSAEIPYFRHLYKSAPSQLIKNHEEGGIIPRYKDEFGVWLSAFASIKNRKGEVVAVVQADQKFDEFIHIARQNIVKNILVSAVLFAILLILLIRLLQPLLKKEQADNEALSMANEANKTLSEQLKKRVEVLTTLDDFRKEMIAGLSHDLRTPMSSILGYLETLVTKKHLLSKEEKERFLQIAFTETKRLSRLVDKLFELSKLESGNMTLEKEPFNIVELAQDTLHKYRFKAKEQNIELKTDIAEDLPFVFADIKLIDRVLQNLLDNALKFCSTNGFVMFTIFSEGGVMHIKVCNNGKPLAEEDIYNVFDRYFTSRNRHTESTGLGLTIVKKIIELHQQKVWAEVKDGVTTFRFTLPLYQSGQK